MARWGENVPEDTVLELGAAALSPDLVDPTALLLRARQSSGELITKERETKIQREMSFYESTDLPMRLDELSTNGDRLQWWKKHEVILPTLAKAAKEILSIPCSSSKSERVFSTGGQVICLFFAQVNTVELFLPTFLCLSQSCFAQVNPVGFFLFAYFILHKLILLELLLPIFLCTSQSCWLLIIFLSVGGHRQKDETKGRSCGTADSC